jgi:formylglycine-generating enzyme required for sulfatase activity
MRPSSLALLPLLAACVADSAATGSPSSAKADRPVNPPSASPVATAPVPQAPATPAPAVQAPAAPKPQASGDFQGYTETIPGSSVTFDLVPIQGGTYAMGSPDGEAGRQPIEGPQNQVQLEPFWMGKCEVRWEEYDRWYEANLPQAKVPDGISKPTPPYTDMTFNMGREGYPAICMSHIAARQYCAWLSKVTGKFYRLPTEAEWEYACRAGTKTRYSFGDDAAQLGDYAWFTGNAEKKYHPVGQKKPNPWGLYDMHGNAAEWVADHFVPEVLAAANGASPRSNPYFPPPRDSQQRPIRFPHAVRGGSWQDDAEWLRSAARRASEPSWNKRDPQIPRSWWYLTEGQLVGFRVVRPLRAPTPEERAKFENP